MNRLLTGWALLALLGGAPPAMAQGDAQESGESTYDRIWRFAEWYEDDTNPVVQRVLFSGRYQHDFVMVSSDQGDHDEANLRRLRLGPRVTLFRTLTFHAELELNPQERDPTFVRFTDFYVQWNRSPQVVLTVGKQGVPFTVDGATSSKELLTIDRSNLSNNLWFPQEYMPGVSVSGRRQAWLYRVGAYSSGDANREFGTFAGGVFVLGALGYDLSGRLGADEALLMGNYVYQHPDALNTFTRQLEHVASLNFRLERGRWGLRADASAAAGYEDQGNLWAVMAMPYVNATDRLQFVGRYTRVEGSDPDAVRLATYENRVVSGRGDTYGEAYIGANYYFYDHKLKLQSGVQVADMTEEVDDDGTYSGVSWTTGLRVSW